VSPVGMAKWFARLTRLVDEHVEGGASVAEQPDAADVDRLRRATHRAIAGVTEDYDAFKYNTVLAKLMGLANETSASVRERGVRGSSVQQSLEAIMLLLAPIAPHIAEELWHRLGHDDSVHLQRFPAHDPALLVEDVVEIPVQVDGKVRDTVQVPSGAEQADVVSAARATDNVAKHLQGRDLVKVIWVPGRMLNLVTRAA